MPAVNKPAFQLADQFRSDVFRTTTGVDQYIRNASEQQMRELRHEYTRMRDTAQKRIDRLGKSEFADFAKTYEQHKAGFQKLRDIPAADLGKAFAELNRFLGSRSSTVAGQREIREETMKEWNNQGIPINKSNYARTMKILNRAHDLNEVYDSDTVGELADLTLGLSEDQFDKVLDHLEDLLNSNLDDFADAVSSYDSPSAVDIDDIVEMMGLTRDDSD